MRFSLSLLDLSGRFNGRCELAGEPSPSATTTGRCKAAIKAEWSLSDRKALRLRDRDRDCNRDLEGDLEREREREKEREEERDGDWAGHWDSY